MVCSGTALLYELQLTPWYRIFSEQLTGYSALRFMEQEISLPVLEVHGNVLIRPESLHILYNLLLDDPFQY
jgi:hypothetical protein